MSKYYLLSGLVLLQAQAGNTFACLGKVAGAAETVVEDQMANGGAEIFAKALVAKALPKLLESGDAQKFEEKTKIKATQLPEGGYAFSFLGIPVGTLPPQEDPTKLVSSLVPHIIAAYQAADKVQTASSPAASSSQQ